MENVFFRVDRLLLNSSHYLVTKTYSVVERVVDDY